MNHFSKVVQTGDHEGTTRNARASQLVAGAAVVAVLLGLSAGLWIQVRTQHAAHRSDSPAHLTHDVAERARNEPVVLSCHVPSGCQASEDDVAHVLRQMEPLPSGMTASLCLHALVAHGFDGKLRDDRLGSSLGLLRVFTDEDFGRQYLGAPAFVRTRYGVRPAFHPEIPSSREGHYDQTLGCLAQLHVPLSLRLHVGGADGTLRDVLRDSLACFELRQGEMEWTAIAYAHYLPPQREWTNKFGARFSFDDVADEVLRRDLSRASCIGCHVVEAIIALLRVDESVAPIVSADVRKRLRARLRDVVAAALARQGLDGSWGPDWCLDIIPRNALRGPADDGTQLPVRMLATSHIAHWMLYLPADVRVSPHVLLRACGWLQIQLNNLTPEFVQQNYCPCTHSAWVLRVMTRGGDECGARDEVFRRAPLFPDEADNTGGNPGRRVIVPIEPARAGISHSVQEEHRWLQDARVWRSRQCACLRPT